MKVSIIMCAYNAAPYIEEAISSITNQTYKNWELIISNDGSTDNTKAIAEKFLSDRRIKLYNHDRNLGYIANKNWALSQASGDLLTQLDADDTSSPERIERQVEILVTNPGLMICGTNYQLLTSEGNTLPAAEYPRDELINFSSVQYPFWFPGLLFRRELIEEFGLFSEYFTGIYGDDYYWTMRVNGKYPIYFIKDVLYGYRINPNSLTNVLDGPRKLIVEDILNELKRQRLTTGSDWLEAGEVEKMKMFEKQLFESKKTMAEKYRIWAAKAIDKKKFREANVLLRKSLNLRPFSRNLLQTFFYFIRSYIMPNQ